MQTEFAPMKSLGFPCHDFVCARSKRIREVLSEIRQTLRKETGFGLDLHPWEATQKSGRRQRVSIQNNKQPQSGERQFLN